MSALPATPASRRRHDRMTDVHRLVQFLLARVEDDEVALKRVAKQVRAAVDDGDAAPEPPPLSLDSLPRRREECASKRRIIGLAQQMLVLRDQPAEEAVRRAAEQVLRELATPYAAHPSYQPEWHV
jgi:hypothetical protein